MKTIIITAGGTSERIDKVRKITNSGSGKLGVIIANQLLKEEDDLKIIFICSKNSLRLVDERVEVKEIEGMNDLANTVKEVLEENKIDYFIHSMAVADYMVNFITTIEMLKDSISNSSNFDEAFYDVEVIKDNKISSDKDNLVIVLKAAPKIISMVKDLSPDTYLVGFKLLDGVLLEELFDKAKKLRDKNKCDLVVANDLETIRSGLHVAYLIDKNDEVEECRGKEDIAKKLVKRIL